METLVKPENETQRLAALERYQMLDTPADGAFDRITALAAMIFKVPIAIISLVDSHRIWFKSHHGLPIRQIDRAPGLCASAILSEDVYVVENARKDPRTLANPLVAGEFGLQFYAAAPLTTDDNYNLGTLCLIDKETRKFTQQEERMLKELGDIVMDEMNFRLALRDSKNTLLKLTSEISDHLSGMSRDLEKLQKEELRSYLNDSSMYLKNKHNQINNL